jgi:hypothetical protein
MNKKYRPLSARTISIDPTKAERLYGILLDRAWHATQELVAKVGHTFAVAKWHLVRLGYDIDKRRHPDERRTFEYRMNRPRPDSSKHIDGFGKR